MIPTAKVTAGALAGALTAIIVWGVRQWAKVDMPPEVAVAVSTVFTFVVSYMTPDAPKGDQQ